MTTLAYLEEDTWKMTIPKQISRHLPTGFDIGPYEFDTTAYGTLKDDKQKAAFLFLKSLFLPGTSQLQGLPGYWIERWQASNTRC